MAINPLLAFAGRITAADANYTYGSSKNETAPGAGDGTPYEKARADDIFGFQQALLRAASIVPSNNAETQLASQYMQAIVELISGRATNYNETGVADAYVLDLQAGQQAPASYFAGMAVRFTPGNNNTGSSSINVAGLGVKSFKYLDGSNMPERALLTTDEVVAVYDGTDFVYVPAVTAKTFAELKTGRKNFFINGDMRIAQRGTSFLTPASTDYTLDRWSVVFNVGDSQPDEVSQRDLGSPDNSILPFDKFIRVDMPAGITGFAEIVQKVEDINRFRSNRTYTLSFYAKGSLAETIQIVQTQNYGVGGSTDDITVPATAAVTTSWQKFEKRISLSDYSAKTIGTGSAFWLSFRTDLSSQVLDIANVQLEEGAIATDFDDRPPAEELALCQRYFYNHTRTRGMSPNGTTAHVSSVRAEIDFPVTMRISPAIVYGASNNLSGLTTGIASPEGIAAVGTATSASLTASFAGFTANAEL